jgi:hypothetical protein
MGSYHRSQVRNWSTWKALGPIDIKKGVEQCCPLTHLLLNICVDQVISFLRKSGGFGYRTAELGETIIQAYTDDMILVSDSEDNLQTLTNRAKSFFDFANIKLNPGKCEVLRVNTKDGTKDKYRWSG